MTPIILAALAACAENPLAAMTAALRLGLSLAPFRNPDGSMDDSKVCVRVPVNGETGVKRLESWRRACHLNVLPPSMVGAPVVGKTYAWFFLDLSDLSAAKVHSGMMDWYALEIGTTVAALLDPSTDYAGKVQNALAAVQAEYSKGNYHNTALLNALVDASVEYFRHSEDPLAQTMKRVLVALKPKGDSTF